MTDIAVAPQPRPGDPAITAELVAEHKLSPEEYQLILGILGREMGKSLGTALIVAIVMLLSNGYPRVSRGHAAAWLAGMAAVGVLLGWLRG